MVVMCTTLNLRVKYPLRFFVCDVQPIHSSRLQIKNCLNSTSVIKVATMQKIRWWGMPQLLSETEVFIALLCQLFLTYYESKDTSAIKVATMKNTDNFRYAKKPSCATTKLMLRIRCQQR